MQVFETLDQLSAAIDTPLPPSEWVTVDQKMVDGFADVTGDHQWIHVDPERAKDGPFGTTIAHGFLTLSLLPLLIKGCYDLRVGSMRVNYGLNKVRFPTPVPVGTRIRGLVTLSELVESPSGRRLTSVVTIEGEGLAKPACIAEFLSVIID